MLRPLRKFKKSKKMPKAELVPVLDAVFIMIFFILATAEFLKISEIGSDLPVMKLSMDENPEKKKLLLKMQLSLNQITLLNEVDRTELFIGPIEDMNVFKLLNDKIKSIKADYPQEERITVTSAPTIKYDIVIKALDAVRQSSDSAGIKTKLFTQIMFR